MNVFVCLYMSVGVVWQKREQAASKEIVLLFGIATQNLNNNKVKH